jgi:ligand-binding sensor domain-containing protein
VFIGTEAGLSLRFTPGRTDLCNEFAAGCIVPSFFIHDYAALDNALWVATPEGLARFNGTGWDSLNTLPAGSAGGASVSLAVFEDTVWDVRGTEVRRLGEGGWESTDLQAARLAVSEDRLFAMTASRIWHRVDDAWQELSVPSVGEIRDLVTVDGRFYLATGDGLVVWDPLALPPVDFVREIPPGPRIPDLHRGLAVDRDGVVWVGNQEGLMSYDGGLWEFFPKGTGGLDGEWIFSLATVEDELAVGHCCCTSPPRCRLDVGTEGEFGAFEAFDAWGLDVDGRGRIWAATDGYGVSVLERRGPVWEIVLKVTNANTSGRLRSNSIRAVTVTSEGTYFGHSQSLGVDFWPHDGNLPSGDTISPEGWRAFTTLSNLLDGSVSSLQDRARDVYVGTSTGLHRISIGAVVESHRTNFVGRPGDLSRIVQAIVIDRSGGVWAGTNNGVLYLGPGANEFRLFDTDNSDLTHNDVLSGALNPVDGSVWFGTALGITRVDPIRALGLPSDEEVFTLYPNPFRLDAQSPFRITLAKTIGGGFPTTAAEDIGEARVFDLAGQDIGAFRLEQEQWIWDMRNPNGEFVVPGLYVVRARTARGEIVDLKLGILR